MVNLRSDPITQRVLIKAQGIKGDDCINTEESSFAEPNGQFRVRGLKVSWMSLLTILLFKYLSVATILLPFILHIFEVILYIQTDAS